MHQPITNITSTYIKIFFLVVSMGKWSGQNGIKKEKTERLRCDEEKVEYIRVVHPHAGIEHGSVMIGKRVIWAFPHIKRIFALEAGLKRNITAPLVYAEEKIDGFNVRVISSGGRILAFSRGGFLDLFVTEKVREIKGITGFFKDYPDQILCGEMIGNTPHTKPTSEFDVRFFIFDIDDGDGAYLPCNRRYEIIRKYKLTGVPQLGKFRSDDYKALGKLVLALNKGQKEGVVLKSEDRREVVKYVTPNSDIEDITKCSQMTFDMPVGFYHQRILRSAFFISDFGLDREEYAKKLGKAFYDGLIRAVRDVKEGKEIDEECEISIRNEAVWEDIRKHMGKEIRIEELWRRSENGKTRIRFRKIFKKTTKLLSSYANGKGIED